MGKSTISMAIFTSELLNYQRVSCHVMSYHVISIWGELTFHFFNRTFEGPFNCKSVPVRRCPSSVSIWKGKIWGNTVLHHRFGAYNMAVLSWSVVLYIYRPDFSAFFFGVGTSNQSDPGMAIRPGVPFFSWPRWRRNFAMPLFGMWKTVTVGRGREVRWRRDSARGWVSTNLVAYFQGQSLKIYQRYLAW